MKREVSTDAAADLDALETQGAINELRAKLMELEYSHDPLIGNAARVEMTLRCHDSDYIPKVPEAGRVITENSTRVQVMHNGLRVIADGFYGPWMTELIERCRGHHEPQEEAVFHALLQHVPQRATMLELGGFWAYYSMWFLQNAPERRAIVVEPDPAHLAIGRQNAALNNCEIEFVPGFVGGEGPSLQPFNTETSGTRELRRIDVPRLLAERNIKYLDILHCDVQGAELDVLLSCSEILAHHQIGFIVVSTHIFPGATDPLLHQRCLKLVEQLHGEVLAEHDVHEFFSGDGLIVAYFGRSRIEWKAPSLTNNRYSSSFLRNPLIDLASERLANKAEVQRLRSELTVSDKIAQTVLRSSNVLTPRCSDYGPSSPFLTKIAQTVLRSSNVLTPRCSYCGPSAQTVLRSSNVLTPRCSDCGPSSLFPTKIAQTAGAAIKRIGIDQYGQGKGFE